MFTLGIFSTHLPYLMLAMIYGAYIGFQTIAKPGQAADDDNNPAVIISKDDHSASSNTKKSCFYFDYLIEETAENKSNLYSFSAGSLIANAIPLWRSSFFRIPVTRPPPQI